MYEKMEIKTWSRNSQDNSSDFRAVQKLIKNYSYNSTIALPLKSQDDISTFHVYNT